MEQKNLRQVHTSVKTLYEKAHEALRKNNNDFAIELLKMAIQTEPGFTEGREKLRELETTKSGNLPAFTKLMADLKIAFIVMKGRMKMGKSPREAMKIAEEALALNYNNMSALGLLADAAEQLKAWFISIEALEHVREINPEDVNNLDHLAETYQKAGQGMNVLRIRQMISDLKPGNLEAEQAVRQAAALASMEQGKWEEEGDFTSKIKDQEKQMALQREETVGAKNVDDVMERLAILEKEVADGNDSIDNYRGMGEYYYRLNRFDEAINCYNIITEKLGALDPVVDQNIEKAEVGKIDVVIKDLKKQGGQDEKIQQLEEQKYEYRLGRAKERVDNYPNDLELRFAYAVVLWEGEQVDEALQEFQLSQRNPRRRLQSIVYMGRCFHAKGQLDMAIEQFNKAVAEMPVMDKEKMHAMYFQGLVYEDMDQMEKAIECFKEIYQTDIKYKDVGKRIDAYYKSQKSGS